ncbi:MAG: type II toxin-antitoxin system PemK/MazF family toxin [Salinisphaera sp.]|nr:type II toxin-antitoxin system PemK/MazF family toxin [Salinisphaera sp.]
MEVSRGDVVTIAIAGDYGKPRPALVVQHNAFHALGSVVVLRITSELHDWPLFRVTIEPDSTNGLRKRSQVMIDKPATVPKTRIGKRIGQLDATALRTVSITLRRFLDLEPN